jgi:hypothetical protein
MAFTCPVKVVLEIRSEVDEVRNTNLTTADVAAGPVADLAFIALTLQVVAADASNTPLELTVQCAPVTVKRIAPDPDPLAVRTRMGVLA